MTSKNKLGIIQSMETKTCRKCNATLSIDSFRRRLSNGVSYWRETTCRECERAASRMHRLKNIEKYLAQSKEYYYKNKKRLIAGMYEYRKKHKEYMREYLKKERNKTIARLEVRYALAAGRLISKPCEKCGRIDRIHAHHTDYSKPLDVTWLCFKHHADIHGAMRRLKRYGQPIPGMNKLLTLII